MKHQSTIQAALASVVALGFAASTIAAAPPGPVTPKAGQEKCYGVAKAGSNDCANLSGTHSCAGQSKKAMAPDEWNYVAKGTCAKMGGKSLEETKAAMTMKK